MRALFHHLWAPTNGGMTSGQIIATDGGALNATDGGALVSS